MKLGALLLYVFLPTVIISQHHAQTIAADQDLDITSILQKLRSEIAAMREELDIVAKRQQHVVGITTTSDEPLDIDKLSKDIITAMREEIWAVNQMQLAAFYENHVLPERKNNCSQEYCVLPQGSGSLSITPAATEEAPRNGKTYFVFKSKTAEVKIKHTGNTFAVVEGNARIVKYKKPWPVVLVGILFLFLPLLVFAIFGIHRFLKWQLQQLRRAELLGQLVKRPKATQ